MSRFSHYISCMPDILHAVPQNSYLKNESTMQFGIEMKMYYAGILNKEFLYHLRRK